MNARVCTVLGWFVLLILTLLIGAIRVPFSARAGVYPQQIALDEMIIVQLAISTMLFPVLVDDGFAIIVALGSVPFIQLAGFLTGTPTAPLIAVSIAIVLWMIGLRSWSMAIRPMHGRMMIVAMLNCVVIGSPVANYLIREFSDQQDQTVSQVPAFCDPIGTLIQQAAASFISLHTFFPSLLLLGSGVIASALLRRVFSRDRLSTI